MDDKIFVSSNPYQVGEFYLLIDNVRYDWHSSRWALTPYSILYQVEKNDIPNPVGWSTEISIQGRVLASSGDSAYARGPGTVFIFDRTSRTDELSHQITAEEATEWILKNQ